MEGRGAGVMTWIALITWTGRVVVMGQWLINEHAWARWLPWWRRYLSALLWLLMSLAELLHARATVNLFLFALACLAHAWNRLTSKRNRHNKRDMRKLEASRSERLTDVQQTAFRRQVTEAA